MSSQVNVDPCAAITRKSRRPGSAPPSARTRSFARYADASTTSATTPRPDTVAPRNPCKFRPRICSSTALPRRNPLGKTPVICGSNGGGSAAPNAENKAVNRISSSRISPTQTNYIIRFSYVPQNNPSSRGSLEQPKIPSRAVGCHYAVLSLYSALAFRRFSRRPQPMRWQRN